MVDETSVDGLPPSVIGLLRMFLAGSSRGEQVSLVLESRSKAITSKYWCVEKMAGNPASLHPTNKTKKKNPASLRRSKARQEAFFKKKQEEAKSSGNQMTASSMPNKAAAAQQLLVQLESQQAGNVGDTGAGGIPQLDGLDNPAAEETVEAEAHFTFISDYGEEDVLDSFRELFEDNKLVPSHPTLVSRVRIERISADHLCTVKLMIPDNNRDFSWPELPGYPDMFKNVKRL